MMNTRLQPFHRRTMKAALPLVPLILLGASAAWGAWVHESEAEFLSTADFDGDGRADIVIVDKPTGAFRVGYAGSSGSFQWTSAQPSGVENPTACSVARLFAPGREALALTSPAANRIALIDLSSRTSNGAPVSVFLGSGDPPITPGDALVGPDFVVGVDIGGPGNSVLDDLFVSTRWNSPPNADKVAWFRNASGSRFTALGSTGTRFPLQHGNAIALKASGPSLVGATFRTPEGGSFFAFDFSSGNPQVPLSSTDLPPGAGYVAARFRGGPLAQFLFYTRGSPTLLLMGVREPSPGAFVFDPGVSFPMDAPVEQLVLIPAAATTRLLVIYQGGRTAATFDFDGLNPPRLIQPLSAEQGERFTGACVLPEGGFMMFAGRNEAAGSMTYQGWRFDGTRFVPGGTADLPLINQRGLHANVLFFNGEPFVTPTASLLGSLYARDWSSEFEGLPGNISVKGESFAGGTQGLRNPATVTLGHAPSGTTHGLVNQHSATVSLSSRSAMIGRVVAEVEFVPGSGESDQGVSVALRSDRAGVQLWYREDRSSRWMLYSAPIHLFQSSTLQAYAVQPSGDRSRVHEASYIIRTPPGKLDTDNDGVPDYVEKAKGTDPALTDSDNDGYSDFDELVEGSGSEHQESTEKAATFDLHVNLHPYNGTGPGNQGAAGGAAARVFDLHGGLLASGTVPASGGPAILANVAADPTRRLLVLSTEPHFPLPPGVPLGRELVGVMPVPQIDLPTLQDTYTGVDWMTDAGNWILSASNRLAGFRRPTVTHALTLLDTLVVALLERGLDGILASRGLTTAGTTTLLSARPQDARLQTPSPLALRALETTSEGKPAYSLQGLYTSISNHLFRASDPRTLALRRMATNIYRISWGSNQASAGTVIHPLPLDVLRQFIATGTVHSNYLAAGSLTPEEFGLAEQAEARQGVSDILSTLLPRPVRTLILQITASSLSGPCAVLTSVESQLPWALVNDFGEPYRLLEAFQLVPGSRLQVFGFTDAAPGACAADTLQVISANIVSLPLPGLLDADLDGLDDLWEALVQVQSPGGDEDNDGANNLAEFAAGTDPRDPQSRPPVRPTPPPAAPVLAIERLSSGWLRLTWSMTPNDADGPAFELLSTHDLGVAFDASDVVPTVSGRHYEVIVTSPSEGSRFFMLRALSR